MLLNRTSRLLISALGLLQGGLAHSQSPDEVFAVELSYCTVIATYISTTIPASSSNDQRKARAGWEKKALIFNGSAALLTSREFAKTEADAASSRFLIEAALDKEQDTKVKFRTWMNAIDSCEAKLVANKDRLLEMATSERKN